MFSIILVDLRLLIYRKGSAQVVQDGDKELSEKLNKRGFGCIWHKISAGKMRKLKERRSDTECHNLFTDIRDKRSLVFCCDMKLV
jgi:hypothetical protein